MPDDSGSTTSNDAYLACANTRDGRPVTLRAAKPSDAQAVVAVIHEAFGARRRVGARPVALEETTATITQMLLGGAGYLAEVDGRPAGVIIVTADGAAVRLGRVSVRPEFQRQGVATFMVSALLEIMAADGVGIVTLLARQDYPELKSWWESHGFKVTSSEGCCFVMARALPIATEVPDADSMQELGARLGQLMQAGDVIIASGDLGAGKTTFTQGLARGMGVDGAVTSPTFVLARVHPACGSGPALVHADAYRLGGFAELEDLDLEESLADSVTVVEWGAGMAEGLTHDWLELDIRRSIDPDEDTRWVFLMPHGPRWSRDQLAKAVEAAAAKKEETL